MPNLAMMSALGAVAGVTLTLMLTGPMGPAAVDGAKLVLLGAASLVPEPAPRRLAAEPTATGDGAFAGCLGRAGPDPERTLRDILAYHEHAATLSLVECLLSYEPRRFCPPDGAARATDAMEIYLWARDDARFNPPPHGLADRIRLADREAKTGEPPDADPFTLSWSSPRDRALFEHLRSLAAQGYLDVGAFGYSARPDLREALAGVKPQGAPCVGMARAAN